MHSLPPAHSKQACAQRKKNRQQHKQLLDNHICTEAANAARANTRRISGWNDHKLAHVPTKDTEANTNVSERTLGNKSKPCLSLCIGPIGSCNRRTWNHAFAKSLTQAAAVISAGWMRYDGASFSTASPEQAMAAGQAPRCPPRRGLTARARHCLSAPGPRRCRTSGQTGPA